MRHLKGIELPETQSELMTKAKIEESSNFDWKGSLEREVEGFIYAGMVTNDSF